jgi:anti-sigma regulatory factor (Ser/Thr protein kinase)
MVIRIPASPTFLRAAQMAASAVAAQLHFTYDRVSDLRLALAEACTHLTEYLPEDSLPVLHVSFVVDDAKLAVEVRLRDRSHSRSHVVMQTGELDADIRLALLQELVDEACVICDARKGTCVRLNRFRRLGSPTNGVA